MSLYILLVDPLVLGRDGKLGKKENRPTKVYRPLLAIELTLHASNRAWICIRAGLHTWWRERVLLLVMGLQLCMFRNAA